MPLQNPVAEIRFDNAWLDWFAALSGDWNPIHVDPVAARRSLAGTVIVHGMLTLLWSLEGYCRHTGRAPARVQVTFRRPVRIGEMLELLVEAHDDGERLLVRHREEAVALVVVSGEWQRSEGEVQPLKDGSYQRQTPDALSFEALKGREGEIPLHDLVTEVSGRFPSLARLIGLPRVMAVAASSQVVGVHCPGLHSLFSGADFHFDAALPPTASLYWQVSRHTIAQAPVLIGIEGGGVRGSLRAFVRPPPVSQSSYKSLRDRVATGMADGQVAWVVGGSRGLGEVTAKLLAAAGARVVITYQQGAADAQAVAGEIRANGGRCDTRQLDVLDAQGLTAEMDAIQLPDQLYYFASSRISQTRNGDFDREVFNRFTKVYVDALAELVERIKRVHSAPLRVFYPSTVFIDDMPTEFAEYAAAKSAGEALCRHFTQNIEGVDALIARLPRMPTDQTAGVVRLSMADPVDHLMPVVEAMCRPIHEEQEIERSD